MITLVSTRFRISVLEVVIYTQEVYKYLRYETALQTGKYYVFIEQLYQSLLRASGETRIEKKVLEQGISESVRMGFLGDWDFRE